METLRTPDERFENLPGTPFAPNYTEVPDGDGGHFLRKEQGEIVANAMIDFIRSHSSS